MGKGKGGTTETVSEQKVDKELVADYDAFTDMATAFASAGYAPNLGNTIAAPSPLQLKAIENTEGAASAFGLGTGSAAQTLTGLPEPTTGTSGIAGYSTKDAYADNLATLTPEFQTAYDNFYEQMAGAFKKNSKGGDDEEDDGVFRTSYGWEPQGSLQKIGK